MRCAPTIESGRSRRTFIRGLDPLLRLPQHAETAAAQDQPRAPRRHVPDHLWRTAGAHRGRVLDQPRHEGDARNGRPLARHRSVLRRRRGPLRDRHTRRLTGVGGVCVIRSPGRCPCPSSPRRERSARGMTRTHESLFSPVSMIGTTFGTPLSSSNRSSRSAPGSLGTSLTTAVSPSSALASYTFPKPDGSPIRAPSSHVLWLSFISFATPCAPRGGRSRREGSARTRAGCDQAGAARRRSLITNGSRASGSVLCHPSNGSAPIRGRQSHD